MFQYYTVSQNNMPLVRSFYTLRSQFKFHSKKMETENQSSLIVGPDAITGRVCLLMRGLGRRLQQASGLLERKGSLAEARAVLKDAYKRYTLASERCSSDVLGIEMYNGGLGAQSSGSPERNGLLVHALAMQVNILLTE